MSAEEYSLTPNQFRFCEFYIQTSNGTLSSKLAGYSGKDDNSHASMASRLLRNVKIKKYLAKRYSEVAMDANEVLARLAKMARASVSDYVGDTGVIDWKKIAKDGYAVKSITHTKGKNAKVEIEGRLRALELIGKAQSMFTDKIELTDWRSEVLQLLKEGKITQEDIIHDLGDDLATELFVAAGVAVGEGRKAEAQSQKEQAVE